MLQPPACHSSDSWVEISLKKTQTCWKSKNWNMTKRYWCMYINHRLLNIPIASVTRMTINRYIIQKKNNFICFYWWKNWFVMASLMVLPVRWSNVFGSNISGGISSWHSVLSFLIVVILQSTTDASTSSHASSGCTHKPQRQAKCPLMTPKYHIYPDPIRSLSEHLCYYEPH